MSLRRNLHRRPELRFKEIETAKILSKHARALGMVVRTGVAGTGVVAVYDTGRPGAHILIRADMDALPQMDTKAVPYASENPGVAHACGHDVHCVVVLGTAATLMRDWAQSGSGRLTVLFQPAEEIPFGEASGAAAVLAEEAFNNPEPNFVLGLHCWPQLNAGSVGIDTDAAMAAKLAFRVKVSGRGAHAATPQLGSDALLGASQMVVALHNLMSRERDPNDGVALNIGTIQGGTSQSIVSSETSFSGTLRTVSDTAMAKLKRSIERTVNGLGAAFDLQVVVEWRNEMPAVRNAPNLVELAHTVLPGTPEVKEVVEITEPPMTADDFALYANRWPGLYVKLGVAEPESESWPSLHDGNFDVDEGCIATGVNTLSKVATALFEQTFGGTKTSESEGPEGG